MGSFYFPCKRVRTAKLPYIWRQTLTALISTCLATSLAFSSHGCLPLGMLTLRLYRVDQLCVFRNRLHIESIHNARCNSKPRKDP